MVTPPAVLLLLMVVLSILGYFCFQMKFKIIFNICENRPGILMRTGTKCVDRLLLVLISMVSVVISPFSSLILLIWIFFLHLLIWIRFVNFIDFFFSNQLCFINVFIFVFVFLFYFTLELGYFPLSTPFGCDFFCFSRAGVQQVASMSSPQGGVFFFF